MPNASRAMVSPNASTPRPITQNGISLLAMNSARVTGVTLSCSSVPSSFSRTMFIDPSAVATIVTSSTRIPGTM